MQPTLPELSEQLQQQRDRPLAEIRQVETALGAVQQFATLNDQQFVDFVRETYTTREHWWAGPFWKEAVALELRMRHLLRLPNQVT